MGSQVYIVEGRGVPPKVSVVAHELEHTAVLEITNRFEPKDQQYTTLKAVETGVLVLAQAKFGKHDSAFLPGSDDAKVECDGAYPSAAPRIEEGGDEVLTSRRAWELRYTGEDGSCKNYLVVIPEPNGALAGQLAEGLAADFPPGTLELKRVLAGTYQLDADLAAPGFAIKWQPAHPA
jgi:hypothetical protein